jgi:hypothetical protein
LSLHILDMIENSIRAGASEVNVAISEDVPADTLTITIEDNGPGLDVPEQVILDPFYTTKKGKRVGLGLSLFREAAVQAGGDLKLRRSALGGLGVEVTMGLTHVDRPPLGDVAGMVSAVVCTNPDLGLCCTFSVAPRHLTVRVGDVLQSLSAEQRGGLAVARAMAERTRQAMGAVELMP